MNAKKNSRQDLEKRRGTVFAIGLLAAGSFTLAAFTYVSPVEKLEQTISANEARVEVYIQDAEEEEKEVEVIETKTADIVETEESTTTLTAEVTEDIKKIESSNEKVKADVTVKGLNIKKGDRDKIVIETKKVEAQIIDIPDIEAEYIGGFSEMTTFIHGNLKYPDISIELGEEGRVYVEFLVQKDGEVTDVKIAKGTYNNLNREATRIVRSFPKWKPGEKDGRKVVTRVRVPITFTLQ